MTEPNGTHRCSTHGASPWTFHERLRMVFWELCWNLMCSWTPKPLNQWRLFWLKRFGAEIVGQPFVHQRARIQIPWHVSLHDKSCLGDRACLYSLDKIKIESGAVIAQEAYLCTGTHSFGEAGLPLVTGSIEIEKNAFIGARAFIMPGIRVGEGAIVGACAVVTKDVPPFTINAGNPCRWLKSIA